MGVQFGIWHFDGSPVDPDLVALAHSLLRPFACFPTTVLHCGALATMQSTDRTNRAPHRGRNEIQIYWDGRLDNRDELVSIACVPLGTRTDAEIVEQAYEQKGIKLLPRILGDWALSAVREPEHELILAKDSIGTKALFYRIDGTSVAWSTVLEPLALLANRLPPLSEEYLAGWLSFYPESGLTPYQGIFSVPPASFVHITPARVFVQKYWSLESSRPVRYYNDREYEEHFLSIFREAVRRRLNCNRRVLAELSGGMDSSSIVCVADQLLSDVPATQKIDTVTYFDSEETNWDELPYAAKVEGKRGRTGHHIDISPRQCLSGNKSSLGFKALPLAPYARSAAAETFDQIVAENGYRVVLSGLGGDEMLGGVPTPVPELADLAARLRVIKFARQSLRWALAKKKHLLGLWRSTLTSFLPLHRESSSVAQDWQWLTAEFRARNQDRLGFQPQRFRVFGPLPSLQANAAALQVLARQISCVSTASPAYEWRYPFLDRDLVIFCSSIPREQLVRPGQRRSLMRRALVGTVPREVLDRKRKAYVSRGLVKVLAAHWRALKEEPLRLQEIGMVDSSALSLFVERAEHGQEIPILPLLRTLAIERWLRELTAVPQQTDEQALAGSAAPAQALRI